MYDGIYGLVLHYLSSLPNYGLEQVLVDRRNKLIVVDDDEWLLVMQVMDVDLFNYLAEKGVKEPKYLVRFFQCVERSEVIPNTISIMRVLKKDLEQYRGLISKNRLSI